MSISRNGEHYIAPHEQGFVVGSFATGTSTVVPTDPVSLLRISDSGETVAFELATGEMYTRNMITEEDSHVASFVEDFQFAHNSEEVEYLFGAEIVRNNSRFHVGAYAICFTFSPIGEVAISYESGHIAILDRESRKQRMGVNYEMTGYSPDRIVYSSSGRFLAVYSKIQLRVWELTPLPRLVLVKDEFTVTALCFSRDEEYLLVVDESLKLRSWHTSFDAIALESIPEEYTCMCMSNDDATLHVLNRERAFTRSMITYEVNFASRQVIKKRCLHKVSLSRKEEELIARLSLFLPIELVTLVL